MRTSAITTTGAVLDTMSTDNAPVPSDFYSVPPLRRAELFLIDSLREIGLKHKIEAIVATTHGSSGVLVNNDASITPLLDYETPIPEWLDESYFAEVDDYYETLSVKARGGSHLAKQLFWLEKAHPSLLERARWLLPSPQYWAWRLCGQVATEKSSLSASSHLWNSLQDRYTAIVKRRGWLRLMPEIRQANSVLGSLLPDLQARSGLSPATPVLCGVHDSTANFHRFQALGLSNFVVLSTGTWMVGMTDRPPMEQFSPQSNISVHTSATGACFASLKAMAGREFSILCPEPSGKLSKADLDGIISQQTFALPSFTRSSELIANSSNQGRIQGKNPTMPVEREAIALIYSCMLADLMLERLDAQGTIIVDGIFTRQPFFARMLAALRPTQRVHVSNSEHGTAIGAALLARTPSCPQILDLSTKVESCPWPALQKYRDQWRLLAEKLPNSTQGNAS